MTSTLICFSVIRDISAKKEAFLLMTLEKSVVKYRHWEYFPTGTVTQRACHSSGHWQCFPWEIVTYWSCFYSGSACWARGSYYFFSLCLFRKTPGVFFLILHKFKNRNQCGKMGITRILTIKYKLVVPFPWMQCT